jgi:hypothetical protein
VVTEAEREVADPLAIEVDPAVARATVETGPFWFHTFALNRAEGIYTPGAARTAPRFYGLATFCTAAPRQLRPRRRTREQASRADAVAALQDLGAKRN